MRPQIIDVTGGAGVVNSSPIPLNWRARPFDVSLAVDLVGAAAGTYTVQHTFDDIQLTTFDPSTAKWFNDAALVAMTVDAESNLKEPVRAVRLQLAAGASGIFRFYIIQAGG